MDAAHQEDIKEVGKRAIGNSNIASIRTSGCTAACKGVIALHLNSVKLVIQRPKKLRLVHCQDKIDKSLR
jgi:hypothetical protein